MENNKSWQLVDIAPFSAYGAMSCSNNKKNRWDKTEILKQLSQQLSNKEKYISGKKTGIM